jgi:hypothetical protein
MVKGDRVICLIGGVHGFPVVGNVYTITAVSEGLIPLFRLDANNDYWHISRFVLATPLLEALS